MDSVSHAPTLPPIRVAAYINDFYPCAHIHTQDPVRCKKDMEHCIGGCSGESTSALHYDFNTIIALSELNPDVIGFGGFDAARANCTVKVDTIEVPLFEGGDAFQTFAERHRINSGMSALDNTWCDSNPLSCGAIQQALERSPGLVFVPGVGWRHRYDMVPPSPPPPPFPPPRTLFCTCHLHNPPYMTRTHTHTNDRRLPTSGACCRPSQMVQRRPHRPHHR